MKIILASSSPRRKELLKKIVPKFQIIESKEQEKIEEGLKPEEQAVNLAYKKAKNIYEKTQGNRIIISGDTIVTKNQKIYGKPKNKEHAKQIINELLEGDKNHIIVTGLCIIIQKDNKYYEHKQYDKTKIFFKDITNEEIEKWINTGKAMDKAGAYSLQDEFCIFVDKIEGNYTTAIGLPTHKVYDIIKEYIKENDFDRNNY